MIQGIQNDIPFLPILSAVHPESVHWFLMYCEGELQPPDGYGPEAFRRHLLSRAVCLHTSPHRPGSRKRSDIPYPLPSADCFHCIFPEEGGSIASFSGQWSVHRGFPDRTAPFGRLLCWKFLTYRDGGRCDSPQCGLPIPSVLPVRGLFPDSFLLKRRPPVHDAFSVRPGLVRCFRFHSLHQR